MLDFKEITKEKGGSSKNENVRWMCDHTRKDKIQNTWEKMKLNSLVSLDINPIHWFYLDEKM